MSITPSPAAGTRPALPDLQGCRVLLAEDNPVNQRLLVRLLEHVGVQVSVSDNGQQALQQVGEQAFDLLLMDVQMPVLDGLAATRAIRQLGPRGQLPIIAISASTFTEDRQRCLAAGMDDFLAKPIRIEQLYACLAQHLGRHAARLPGEPDAAPRADQPALPRIAGLDTGLGLQHSGGEHALYLDLLQRLLDGERDSPARLRRALDDADLLGAQRLAHTLKGLAGSIGACALADSAAQLEQAIVAGASAARLETLCADLQGHCSLLFAGLGAFFSSAAPANATRHAPCSTPPAATALLRQLARLLDAGDAEALDCLQQHAAGLRSALTDDYPAFERHLRDFDFAPALRILARHVALDTSCPPGTA